jgi:hypothetical protein
MKFIISFPNWLTIVLLLLLLSFTALRSFQKGIKDFRAESERIASQKAIKEPNLNKMADHLRIVRSEEDLTSPKLSTLTKPETKIEIEPQVEMVENPISGSPQKKNSFQFEVLEMKEIRESTNETSDEIIVDPIREDVIFSENFENERNPEDFEMDYISKDSIELEDFSLQKHNQKIVLNLKKNQDLQKILDSESKRFPWVKLVILAFCWVTLFLFSFLKGGKGYSVIGVKSCSFAYWILSMGVFPILFSVSILYGLYLTWTHSKKLKLNYKFHVWKSIH